MPEQRGAGVAGWRYRGRMTAVRFESAIAPTTRAIELDATQRAVVDLPDGASAAVLGAPGTGKTTTIIELLADRVLTRGWSTDELLVLSSSRAAATRLRDALAVRLGRPTNGPLARTPSSFAFELVTASARAAGAEPPRLLTGAEQDADIAVILDGQLADGTGPEWPAHLDPGVRRLRGFRTELRELMSRATEHGITAQRLRELARQTGRDEWLASADFIDDYLRLVSVARESQFDSAELAQFAIRAIAEGEPGTRAAGIRLVLIDDLQEATESTLAMLRAFAGRGVAVIAFGDPDVASNAFRGGEPDALGRLAVQLGGVPVERLVLGPSHRQPPALREFTSRIVERIGTAAAGAQRAAGPATVSIDAAAPPPLARIETVTTARQHAAIARVLREEHLARGVPWGEMAVIVRSGAQAPAIARALAQAEVPTRTTAGGIALRDESAARALLSLVEVGIGAVELTPEVAVDLLLGPFGQLDALELRRLRLAMRAEELSAGGSRQSGDLLVEALSAPGRFVTIDTRVAKTAGRLAETLDLLRTSDGTIEELLWLAWERSRLATAWRDQALGSGVLADEANRNLDAVVALFAAAKDYVERRSQDFESRDLAKAFIGDTLRAEVANDVLAPVRTGDSVLVTTPSGTVGLEFRTVVVTALQDRLWPNLRPRGSLLAPQQLVRALGEGGSTIDERKLVLDDELRVFALAVSRARERVVLAAVVNDDEARSLFFGLLPDGDETPVLDAGAAPLSLRGMVGRLRRLVADPLASSAEVRAAASSLAELARLGLPGAHPDDWHGLDPLSSTSRLYEGSIVRVSPSRIESIEESALDWFLETIAGGDSGVVANVGTILHWAMETTDDPTVDKLWSAVEQRWGELVFDSPWLAERHLGLARGFTEALADYLRDFAAAGGALAAAEGRFVLEYATPLLPPLPALPDDPERGPQPQIQVNGSIDRIEMDAEGRVVIVDLKTGRPKSAREVETLAQLGAYQLAYAEGQFDERLEQYPEHEAGGAKLLFVRDGTKNQRYREAAQPLLDAGGLDEVRERIRRAAVIIAAAEFSGKLELDAYRGFGNTPRLRLHRVPAVSSD
jgi:superfamily I DNA/RNA helicase